MCQNYVDVFVGIFFRSVLSRSVTRAHFFPHVTPRHTTRCPSNQPKRHADTTLSTLLAQLRWAATLSTRVPPKSTSTRHVTPCVLPHDGSEHVSYHVTRHGHLRTHLTLMPRSTGVPPMSGLTCPLCFVASAPSPVSLRLRSSLPRTPFICQTN